MKMCGILLGTGRNSLKATSNPKLFTSQFSLSFLYSSHLHSHRKVYKKGFIFLLLKLLFPAHDQITGGLGTAQVVLDGTGVSAGIL